MGFRFISNGGNGYFNHSTKVYRTYGGRCGLYKMDENLSETINKRLKHLVQDNNNDKYFLINFSCIPDFGNVSDKLLINIYDSIKYTEFAEHENIELLKALPYFWLCYESDIIYLVNNVKAVRNNKLWFDMRKNHKDMIIDLSGNCLKCWR